jgi:hypothetical protein
LKLFLELPEDNFGDFYKILIHETFEEILPIGWKNNTKNGKPNFPHFIILTTLKN